MAGSFGYEAAHVDVSLRWPSCRCCPRCAAAADTLIVADGTSCRHQIGDNTARATRHAIRVLEEALDEGAVAEATPG